MTDAQLRLLLLSERLAGHLQEDLAVAAQGLGGRRVEAGAHAHRRKLEGLLAFLGEGLLRTEFGPCLRQFHLEAVHAAAADQPAGHEREDRQGDQPREQ